MSWGSQFTVVQINPKLSNLCLGTNLFKHFMYMFQLNKIKQTIKNLLTNYFMTRPRACTVAGVKILKILNEEAQQYEGASQPVKLIASAFLFAQT